MGSINPLQNSDPNFPEEVASLYCWCLGVGVGEHNFEKVVRDFGKVFGITNMNGVYMVIFHVIHFYCS